MESIVIDKEILKRYDVAGPRYTSYPTAPEWSTEVNAQVYQEKLRQFAKSNKTLSLYIHLPFCQSLCYFCACNVVIRKRDDKYGDEYLEYLFKEIDLICDVIGKRRKIRQFHWGGGTPTFLTESQIERLFEKVRSRFDIDFDGEIAIEIDPRTIDLNKIKTLKSLGFNRISMGVQDFDEGVQEKVNRIQPFEMVERFYGWCRELKFLSINCDLIYGLPGQTRQSFRETIDKIIELKPDRIALYSFAHVPWIKKHQIKLSADELPGPDEKLEIFLQSRNQFLNAGYAAIAMDHFALKTDEMAQAFANGTLYRNFMGYTVKPANEFIGMGITAIGFLENTFIQNHKTLKEFYGALDDGILPIERGKVLSSDDQIRQWVISKLMCQFKVDKREFLSKFALEFDSYFNFEQTHLKKCETEGFLQLSDERLDVTDLGKIFIRNICMGFDWYLRQSKAHREFSRTV